MTNATPKVFVSYSHDNQEHKDWILRLSTRLVNNGVDVMLDQWNLRLGSDLPLFMESGLSEADRVLAVCSEPYVSKANAAKGGVGYERMILTAQLMRDIPTSRIIPVIRNNALEVPTPLFLSSRLYIDFRDEKKYEENYVELLRDIHGESVKPRPTLGKNPFSLYSTPSLSFSAERYCSPALTGVVTFDYSNNDGCYVLGLGDLLFETHWSRAGTDSIHAYRNPPSIRSVALALDVKEITAIADASAYDNSSRVRSPRTGEIVLWQNVAGYYLATRIERVRSRGHGAEADELEFSYIIQPDRSASFLR